MYCSGLTTLILSYGLEEIGEQAFYNAFKGCTNLMTLNDAEYFLYTG